MTINIGSNKISRLAIGQADGTTKEISQMNLGSKVIFRMNGGFLGTPTYDIPSIATETSFVVHFFGYNKIKNNVASITVNPRFAQTGVMYLYYTSNYSQPNQSISFSYDRPNLDLSPYINNIQDGGCIVLNYNISGYLSMASGSSFQPLISVADSNNNAQPCAILSKEIPLSNAGFRWDNNGNGYNAYFRDFNNNGSIVDIKDGLFQFPTGWLNNNTLFNFNTNGRLHRIPSASFDTQFGGGTVNTSETQVVGYGFNGTSTDNAGDLLTEWLNPEITGNEVFIANGNQSTQFYRTIIYTKTQSHILTPKQAYKWNTDPVNWNNL